MRTGGHVAARKRHLARMRMRRSRLRYRERLRREEPETLFGLIGDLLIDWSDED